jgi:hypothetical protein
VQEEEEKGVRENRQMWKRGQLHHGAPKVRGRGKKQHDQQTNPEVNVEEPTNIRRGYNTGP